MEKKGYSIIIIGDKEHAEVKGIVGHLKNKPLVISNIKRRDLIRIKKIKKACVVVQSTQNMEKTDRLFSVLKRHINDLKIFNTICNTTKAKQNEIKIMPLENNVMIIIGSKTSANTKRLYQISKSLNKKSYWVQSKEDIKKSWFRKAKKVGIHAGASTPNYITQGTIQHIKQLTKDF
jgi:4-hydroxy-3-methylbut-2-enyl diphosphate reductase